MKTDVDGGYVGDEGQKDESLFLPRFPVQGMQLERLPLLHLGATALRLQL